MVIIGFFGPGAGVIAAATNADPHFDTD
jgi:hypothetical protein